MTGVPKCLLGFTLGLLALLVPAAGFAQTVPAGAGAGNNFRAGDWMARLRIVGIIPNHGGAPISPIGGTFDDANLATPEIDLTYFFTPRLAVEAETGVFQESITARNTAFGTMPVGTVDAIPIVLAGQYHALPQALIDPYVGIGLAVVPYFNAQPAGGLVQQLSVDTKCGAVFQLGADLHLGGPWFANLDVKKLILPAQASANNGQITAAGQANPWILGGGIGFRF